ncbi:solute carrier family 23 member 2-like [Haliotis rufescens]|uniref:solute carrier family 23 member 2-like n=1 Tax=Haliotis rufescens TaxID=6454 RepID=UPI00201F13CE|nr:solute carrier family 23 member 2-like [Haliotis rufescens]
MEECTELSHPQEDGSEVRVDRRLLYPVDTSPPFPSLLVHGLQQAFQVISGSLPAAVVIANLIGAGEQWWVRAELLSLCLFTSGLATLLQICVGCRLPLIQGPAGTILVAIVVIVSDPKLSDGALRERTPGNDTSTAPWKKRMTEIQGNLMLASGAQFLLGVSGALGFLLRFIGPLTVAPTVLVLGITLCRYMIPLCEQHWGIASLTISLYILFSVFLVNVRIPFLTLRRRKCHVTRYALFQLNAVILAVAVSWMTCHVLTVTNMLPGNSTLHGHMARTDVRMRVLNDAPWIFLPVPFPYGMPTISASGFAAMVTVTMVLIIQIPGTYSATSSVIDLPQPPAHAINRGIVVDGLTGAISGMLGGVMASMAYVQSLGVVAVTKVASRKVFVSAALILMVGGVVGKVGAVFTIIPDPVVGGVNLVATSTVTAVGVSMLHTVDLSSSRNLLILGTSVTLGILLPDWMAANEDSINTGNKGFDQVIIVLLSTPMFVSSVLGCVLDNLAPGTLEERGVAKRDLARPCDRYLPQDDPYRLPYITRFMDRVRCCSFFPLSPTFNKEVTCQRCDRTDSKPC